MTAQSLVEKLNSLVQLDWKAMHRLVENRVPANAGLTAHPTVICVADPMRSGAGVVGMLGIFNGLLRDTPESPKLLANYQDGELTGFHLSDDTAEIVDHRTVTYTDMKLGSVYRVKDRAGNRWEGTFTGFGQAPNEGVYLQLPKDGSIARIFFHDVMKVIRA